MFNKIPNTFAIGYTASLPHSHGITLSVGSVITANRKRDGKQYNGIVDMIRENVAGRKLLTLKSAEGFKSLYLDEMSRVELH